MPHCLHTRARGIFGRGRDIRFAFTDSGGVAGNLRGVVDNSGLVNGLVDMMMGM